MFQWRTSDDERGKADMRAAGFSLQRGLIGLAALGAVGGACADGDGAAAGESLGPGHRGADGGGNVILLEGGASAPTAPFSPLARAIFLAPTGDDTAAGTTPTTPVVVGPGRARSRLAVSEHAVRRARRRGDLRGCDPAP